MGRAAAWAICAVRHQVKKKHTFLFVDVVKFRVYTSHRTDIFACSFKMYQYLSLCCTSAVYLWTDRILFTHSHIYNYGAHFSFVEEVKSLNNNSPIIRS